MIRKSLGKILITLATEKEKGYESFAGLNILQVYRDTAQAYRETCEATKEVDEMLPDVEAECHILESRSIIQED